MNYDSRIVEYILDEFIERQDIEKALEILHETVPQWHRSSKSESF